MVIQGSPFTCPRGVVLDDGWRKAVSPHPFSVPRRCPEARYCILRYRVDNRPSSFQDVQRYPRDSGRSWREGIRFIFPATYQEHKLADLQKSEITHTVLFVLHFQQNRWMTCFLCVIANCAFFSYSASRLTLSCCCWAIHESITFIIYRQESFYNSHLPFLVVL